MNTPDGPARTVPPADSVLEFIFLGTGTSSSLPHVACLTAPAGDPPCCACLAAVTPEGQRNRRRNTSGVVRMKDKNGKMRTIVIDAGKTFQAAALKWFPKYGLRRIDALLITHAHADAMNGLDDLRAWTLRGAIQKHIDLYVSQNTFEEVQRSFPYLVAKEFASGGGDVPDFKWHIIQDQEQFEIADTGIMVTPFQVEHGRIFSTPPPAAERSRSATPSIPDATHPQPAPALAPGPVPAPALSNGATSPASASVPVPYYCFGFKFGNADYGDVLAYASDVSAIPASAMQLLKRGGPGGGPAPLLVLDCLRLLKHTSHFGLQEAAGAAREIGARRTFLVGFSHDVAHEEWERILPAARGTLPSREDMSKVEREGIELLEKEKGKPVELAAAWDGMRCWVGSDGDVHTDE